MAHLHSVYDSDAHFSINPITRALKNEASSKTSLIQYDHNSERFTFEIPRMVEGHDMSLCNKIRVHYINIDSKTKAQVKGVYEVEDMQISPESDDVVICSWLISRNSTQLVGSLTFLIRFSCVTEGADDQIIVDYAWNTATYTGISVSSGIDADETFEEDYVDVIEQWKESVVLGFEDDLQRFADEMKVEVSAWEEAESANVRAEMTVFSEQWNDALGTERARIDNIVALPNGSTTGDAELMDARVDCEGKTWANAGAHVRSITKKVIDAAFDKEVISRDNYNLFKISEATYQSRLQNDSAEIVSSTAYNVVSGWIPVEYGKYYTISVEIDGERNLTNGEESPISRINTKKPDGSILSGQRQALWVGDVSTSTIFIKSADVEAVQLQIYAGTSRDISTPEKLSAFKAMFVEGDTAEEAQNNALNLAYIEGDMEIPPDIIYTLKSDENKADKENVEALAEDVGTLTENVESLAEDVGKNTVSKPTKNKQMLIFGDSITETATMNDDGSNYVEGKRVNWMTFAKTMLGTENFKNYAKSGATYKDQSAGEFRQSVSNQIALAMADSANDTAEIIVLSLGTNDGTANDDYNTAMAVETVDALDRTKLYQAIRHAMWTLKTKYPNAKCFVATPIQRKAREQDVSLRTAIIAMGNRYNFKVIDAEFESGIIRENEVLSGAGVDLYDGLHPNENGARKMAELFSSVILNSFSYDAKC